MTLQYSKVTPLTLQYSKVTPLTLRYSKALLGLPDKGSVIKWLSLILSMSDLIVLLTTPLSIRSRNSFETILSFSTLGHNCYCAIVMNLIVLVICWCQKILKNLIIYFLENFWKQKQKLLVQESR